jgi:YgiT-type zinc finger domain-containing protein
MMMNHDYGHCHACGGRVEERLTEQSVRDGEAWVLIRAVPTGVCTRCGEQIFRLSVAERLEQITRQRERTAPSTCIEVPVYAF